MKREIFRIYERLGVKFLNIADGKKLYPDTNLIDDYEFWDIEYLGKKLTAFFRKSINGFQALDFDIDTYHNNPELGLLMGAFTTELSSCPLNIRMAETIVDMFKTMETQSTVISRVSKEEYQYLCLVLGEKTASELFETERFRVHKNRLFFSNLIENVIKPQVRGKDDDKINNILDSYYSGHYDDLPF
jgi:hypothetical protein